MVFCRGVLVKMVHLRVSKDVSGAELEDSDYQMENCNGNRCFRTQDTKADR